MRDLDGATMLESGIRNGLAGGGQLPAYHPSHWNWDNTRTSLWYAMQGFTVKPRGVRP